MARWLLLLGLVVGVAFGGCLILGGVMLLHKRYWEYPNWVTPIIAGTCIVAATILWFINRLPERTPPSLPISGNDEK